MDSYDRQTWKIKPQTLCETLCGEMLSPHKRYLSSPSLSHFSNASVYLVMLIKYH